MQGTDVPWWMIIEMKCGLTSHELSIEFRFQAMEGVCLVFIVPE